MIEKVNIPTGKKGKFKIKREYVKPNPYRVFSGRYVPEGEYTFLYRGGTLVMSDTPDEMRDHYHAVINANGRCLVAGLGIGMVLNAMAKKEEVTRIDVVELEQDVIDLVSRHYEKLYPGKIFFYNCSIFDFAPEKGVKYDCAWFDIWDDLCTDNLKEMEILHRKFSRKAKWKGSWGKELLKLQKKREDRESRMYRYF